MVRRAGERTRGSGAWVWSRTAETRRAFLDAGRSVFAAKGFAEATVADIVEGSGQSVGSLYHHFGGKTELYLALWELHQEDLEQASSAAVADARAAGEADRFEQFSAGARAYLRKSWERRDLVRLFAAMDGPPGFAPLRRSRGADWVRQNTVLLEAGGGAVARLTVSVLTVVIGEAAREVAVCPSAAEADTVTEAALDLLRRMDPLAQVEAAHPDAPRG
ncbi:TetR/AcrR family transcriptional regulator [Nocardiopsis coralliicola]